MMIATMAVPTAARETGPLTLTNVHPMRERYRDPALTSLSRTNAVIELQLAHRSVRAFLDAPVGDEELTAIVAAAQSASTSSNLQAWSVVAVREPARRVRLATLAGDQDFIRRALLLLVWLADLGRIGRGEAAFAAAHRPASGGLRPRRRRRDRRIRLPPRRIQPRARPVVGLDQRRPRPPPRSRQPEGPPHTSRTVAPAGITVAVRTRGRLPCSEPAFSGRRRNRRARPKPVRVARSSGGRRR